MKSAPVSEILDDLIEVCLEGEACYRACAQLVRNDAARRSLKNRARHAERARRQLSKLRKQMGSQLCVGPALCQPAALVTQSHGFAVSDEASALGMCERLAAVAMMRYRDALDFDLPEQVRKVLQRQFDILIARHANGDLPRSVQTRRQSPPAPGLAPVVVR